MERAEAAPRGLDMRAAIVIALTALLGIAGFLIAGTKAQGAVGTGATVSLRTTKLGAILVNSRGHTLYLFLKDKNDKSSCTGSCAKFWPPLTVAGKATAGAGVKASLLGITMRSDGSHQVTYNRHPLYAYSLDKAAGQTNGQGVSAFGAMETTTASTNTIPPYPTTP